MFYAASLSEGVDDSFGSNERRKRNRGVLMKNMIRVLAIIMLMHSTAALAQAGAQSGSQKRLVQIDESTGDLVEVAQVAPQATAPIVINNNQKSTQGSAQTAIQEQPTTVIEDSPLSMSSAERRRRERQSLELQTESRIVEKLEEGRMEDERRRSERIFNQSFGSGDHAQPAPQQIQVLQAPPSVPVVTSVVAPVAPVEVVKAEPKVNVKEELRAALEEMKPKEESKLTEYYVQGLVGMGNYPDAINIRGNVSTGFSVGIVTPERIVAEGTFQYSQFDIETMTSNPPFKTLSQYNFSAAMKYQILSGRVRPVVGAIAGYTYRSYRDQVYYSYSSNVGNASTNAFDVGGLVGLDVQLTNSFSLGADFRYMKNVAYRQNSDYQRSFVYQGAGRAVEEIDYYLSSLVARFIF